jgi:2-phospho-L-lactate guanylyltransferase
VTADPDAAALARRYGAEVAAEGARGGHTAAVAAAQHQLAARHLGMLALPADVPLVEPADLQHLLAAHRPAPAFTIAPAHDRKGSNAVLCTPADAVPLRFGDDSFLPHLAASRGCGIEPTVLALPNLALDIDTPDDLARLLAVLKRTATRALLDRWQIGAERLSAGGAEPRP